MKTLALLARKGGVGKTTLAAHLAVIAAESRRVLLVDTDPQRSATDWWNARSARTPELVTCEAGEVPDVLHAAREDGVDLVVIDTRPSVEADTAAIARLADLVLIPTRPAILDLRAIGATVEVLNLTRTPAVIVLNATPPPRGATEASLTAEARAALAAYGLPVAQVAVGNRAALSHALVDGRAVTEFEPKGRATGELRGLFTMLEKELWPAAQA